MSDTGGGPEGALGREVNNMAFMLEGWADIAERMIPELRLSREDVSIVAAIEARSNEHVEADHDRAKAELLGFERLEIARKRLIEALGDPWDNAP